MSSGSLYRELVKATTAYLGPTADRFVSKQISGHLDKSPEKLVESDLDELIKWIKPTMALLNEDSHLVDKYIDSLMSLIGMPRRNV